MKKSCIVILSVLLLTVMQCTFIHAETADTIGGLHEKLSEIYLSDVTDTELLNVMNASYDTFLNSQIETMMSAPDYAKEKIGLTGDYNNQVQQIREMYQVDFKHGILVNNMIWEKYSQSYADAKVFNYLLSGDNYWVVPLESGKSFVCFDTNGNYLNEIPIKIPTVKLIDFIFDVSNMNTLLKNINIQKIDDIKVFILEPYGTLIYAREGINEFIYRFESINNSYEEIQNKYFKANAFCEAKEAIGGLSSIGNSDGYISFTVDEKKADFLSEAKKLQTDGILNGNENGLDLLKPLTRIEAAAILVRVADLEPVSPESNVQTFSDVPTAYWGYASAESAAYNGIVYGIGDNLFAPERTVTSTEFASMVLRASGENDFNWQEAINLIIDKGIITHDEAENMDFFTRGDMAKIIFEARNKGLL